MAMTAVERAQRAADRAQERLQKAREAEIAQTKIVGEILTRERNLQGLSPEELSTMVQAGLDAEAEATGGHARGYPPSRIVSYERGYATPTGQVLAVLCDVLGLDVKQMMTLRKKHAEIEQRWGDERMTGVRR